MGTLNWTVTHTPVGGSPTNITSRVLSVNITQGRPQYLDQYSGGSMTLTINNSSNYASGIGYGSTIQITNNGTAGAITLSGFSKTTGNPFTTTNGHDFFVYVTKCNGFTLANVVALQ